MSTERNLGGNECFSVQSIWVCVCVCGVVVKSIISTMTEIQEAAPSATNVAASIKFPPTTGHRRKSTSESVLTYTNLHPSEENTTKQPQRDTQSWGGNSQKSEESRR